jgi:ATP-binding cassette subfamily B protein
MTCRESINTALPKTLLPFIWHFVKRYKFSFALFVSVPLLMALETTVQPYGIKLIIDTLSKGASPGEGVPSAVILGAFLYVGTWTFEVSIFRFQEWWQTRVIPRFQADIRMQVMNHLSQQSYTYFTNQLSGNLSTKVSDLPAAIDQIRLIFCWSVVGTLAVVISSLILIASVNLLCGAVLAGLVLIHFLISTVVARQIDQASRTNAEDKSQLTGAVVDMLTNILPIKLFARRGFELHHLQGAQDIERRSNHGMLLTVCRMRFFMDILVTLMMAGVLTTLILGWTRGLISSGDLAMVIISMLVMINQLWYMAQNLMDFFRQIGIAKQALALVTAPIMITDAPGAKPLKVTRGEIVFNEVCFQYHEANALFTNKNLTIEPGTKVGLVGYSGSGKTTFVHLILRFFDLISGEILIDNQNIAQVTQDSLHENIVMVPQDTTLFHRSLRENIAYGNPEATEAQIIQAAKDAHCHEFISALPEGYETWVGDRGIKLSGGQRQRIAIARAMLKPAPILILDEATAALDSVTEKFIQESIQRVMENRTTLVVAHRLSTLSAMDRILVFDQGHIIEDGTHASLLALQGRYAKMWEMQAGGFLPS